MGLQALLNKYDNGGFTKTGWFQLKDDGGYRYSAAPP